MATTEGLSEEAATADNADQPGPFSRLVNAEWQTLLDKDDRTSPAEHPEMCLITQVELACAMTEAWELGRNAALNFAARAEGPAPPGGGARARERVSRAAYNFMRSDGFSGGWDHDGLADAILAALTQPETPDHG